MRFYRGKQPFDVIKDREHVDLCLCHKEYNHCVSNREDGVIIEIDPNDELDTLNITARSESQMRLKQKVTTTTTTEAPQVTQALGFEVSSCGSAQWQQLVENPFSRTSPTRSLS